MGRELYDVEPAFRSALVNCCDAFRGSLGFDLRDVLYPAPDQREVASARLQRTAVTQPALFAVEYALAKLWMSFGIEPKGMIGHSIGEYVAACLAGVFSFEDALDLVAARGRLMDEMPAGSMLAAPLSEREAQPFLDAEIALAAVNAPGFCVFSGPTAAIDRLGAQLSAQGVHARPLHTSHAFHSSMMDPVVPALVERVQRTVRKAPQIPYLSNLTGTWMTPEAALDAAYWGRHLRETVRFADGLAEVMKYPEVILLEVGPGQTLSTLARQQPSTAGAPHVILNSLRAPQETQSDEAFLLNTVGTAWLSGAPVSWTGFFGAEKRRRVALPTYPFERQSYWVGPREDVTEAGTVAPAKPRDVSNWFYAPKWEQRQSVAVSQCRRPKRWLLFSDGDLGSEVRTVLERGGDIVSTAIAADEFSVLDDRSYSIRPDEPRDYERLFKELRESAGHAGVHSASVDGPAQRRRRQRTRRVRAPSVGRVP